MAAGAVAIFLLVLFSTGLAGATPKTDDAPGRSGEAPGHNKDADDGSSPTVVAGVTEALDAGSASSSAGADAAGGTASSVTTAAAVTSPAAASTSSSKQVCDGDPSGKSASGNGANTDGVDNDYHHNCGADSANGNGGGKATGRPCAGCVGNADDKNPPGQFKNGGDANSGYECDVKGKPNGGNNGVGKGNPAHTPCKNPPTKQTCPDGSPLPPNGKCPTTQTCPDGSPLPANGKCPTTKTCPDGSPLPATGGCGSSTNSCPDGSALPASGTCPGGGSVNNRTLARPTQVLGVEISRGSGTAGLAFTGTSIAPMLASAVGLIGLGSGLLGAVHRRREDPNDFIRCRDRLVGYL